MSTSHAFCEVYSCLHFSQLKLHMAIHSPSRQVLPCPEDSCNRFYTTVSFAHTHTTHAHFARIMCRNHSRYGPHRNPLKLSVLQVDILPKHNDNSVRTRAEECVCVCDINKRHGGGPAPLRLPCGYNYFSWQAQPSVVAFALSEASRTQVLWFLKLQELPHNIVKLLIVLHKWHL